MTSTRFRRRPSRLPGQPFRLALKDPLPGAKDFGELGEAVEAAIRHRNHDFAAHDLPLQVRVGIPVTSLRTGVLAGAVVQPAPGPAWSICACGASLSSHTS